MNNKLINDIKPRLVMSAITVSMHESMCVRAKCEPNTVFRYKPLNFFESAQSGSDYKI